MTIQDIPSPLKLIRSSSPSSTHSSPSWKRLKGSRRRGKHLHRFPPRRCYHKDSWQDQQQNIQGDRYTTASASAQPTSASRAFYYQRRQERRQKYQKRPRFQETSYVEESKLSSSMAACSIISDSPRSSSSNSPLPPMSTNLPSTLLPFSFAPPSFLTTAPNNTTASSVNQNNSDCSTRFVSLPSTEASEPKLVPAPSSAVVSSSSVVDEAQTQGPSAASVCPLFFRTASSVVPHPQKVDKGGEDAHWASKSVLVVADGVGGWAGYGIDPSMYSNQLVQGVQKAVENETVPDLDPRALLWAGYNGAKDVVGSCTACVVSLVGNKLRVVNLGDSGVIVIRNSQVIFRSKEQQYSFNFPYQLGTNSDCSPDTADASEIELQEGDIVISGTDGLFDNLFDSDLVDLTIEHDDPQALATSIASLASECACCWVRNSPFAIAGQKAGQNLTGGKLDDITVVVGKVTSCEEPEDNSAAST